MKGGMLRHRLVIEQPTDSRTATGAVSRSWSTFATVWADIQPVKARELLAGNQILAEMDTVIRIRWSPNVDQVSEKWRATHDGVTYNIVSVAHKGYKRQEIELLCKSGANNG